MTRELCIFPNAVQHSIELEVNSMDSLEPSRLCCKAQLGKEKKFVPFLLGGFLGPNPTILTSSPRDEGLGKVR